MNPCELTLGITSLANTIACRLSEEEIDLLAAVFNQLGETLETISAQRAFCEAKASAVTSAHYK